jgi:hypothetical protein
MPTSWERGVGYAYFVGEGCGLRLLRGRGVWGREVSLLSVPTKNYIAP